MAAVITCTEIGLGTVKKITWAWTCSTDGDGTSTTTGVYDGKVLAVHTIPNSTGAAPTDNYDITVTDADGYDVLLGAAMNRAATEEETIASTAVGAVASSKLTFNVAAAGDAKKGTATMWIR